MAGPHIGHMSLLPGVGWLAVAGTCLAGQVAERLGDGAVTVAAGVLLDHGGARVGVT